MTRDYDFTDLELHALICEALQVIGASESDFDTRRNTFLHSDPVWPGPQYSVSQFLELVSFIDHTLLRPNATDLDIWRLCLEARAYPFASVCVNSTHVAQCVKELAGTEVGVCSVVGFPLGASCTEAKSAEAEFATDAGAAEIDMVLNIGKLKSDTDGVLYAYHDIQSVVEAAWGIPVKVILETCLLSAKEIVLASTIAIMAGAVFVKTSTGFSKGGARADHVRLMRRIVGPHLGVKASGGIRDTKAALEMIRAGANRIGTSNGPAIIQGKSLDEGY